MPEGLICIIYAIVSMRGIRYGSSTFVLVERKRCEFA